MAKNLELYNKTVDILFQAYFNDTLVHGNCYACAVGNIVAANMHKRYIKCKDEPDQKIVWADTGGNYCHPGGGCWFNNLRCKEKTEEGNNQIKATGYDFFDVDRIERAFESPSYDDSNEDRIFNGLCAVLEVLKQIHEITDNEPEVTRFKEHYKVKQLT